MTADASIEGRLQATTQRYLQAQREVELARENLVDAAVDAQEAGFHRRAVRAGWSDAPFSFAERSRCDFLRALVKEGVEALHDLCSIDRLVQFPDGSMGLGGSR